MYSGVASGTRGRTALKICILPPQPRHALRKLRKTKNQLPIDQN